MHSCYADIVMITPCTQIINGIIALQIEKYLCAGEEGGWQACSPFPGCKAAQATAACMAGVVWAPGGCFNFGECVCYSPKNCCD